MLTVLLVERSRSWMEEVAEWQGEEVDGLRRSGLQQCAALYIYVFGWESISARRLGKFNACSVSYRLGEMHVWKRDMESYAISYIH